MAIVKMKKLRVMAMAADQERLLHQLQHLGCVEISQPSEELEDTKWASMIGAPRNPSRCRSGRRCPKPRAPWPL